MTVRNHSASKAVGSGFEGDSIGYRYFAVMFHQQAAAEDLGAAAKSTRIPALQLSRTYNTQGH